MVLAVFVLKSSFAKRQNINIVSLLVLACDDVPAEARHTVQRQLILSWLLSPTNSSTKGGSERKTFPLLSPSSLGSYVYWRVISPSHSPTLLNLPSFSRVCHSFDSSSVLLLMTLLLILCVPSPILSFFY